METTLALVDSFLPDLSPTQMLVGTSLNGKGLLAVVKAQPAQLSGPGEPLYWLDVVDEELEEHVSQRRGPVTLARVIPWLIGAFSKNDSYDLFQWQVEEAPAGPWPIT